MENDKHSEVVELCEQLNNWPTEEQQTRGAYSTASELMDRSAAMLSRQAEEIARHKDCWAEQFVKLHSGTLHELHCNANHSGPIGNDGCSCTIGYWLKALRADRARANEDCANYLEQIHNLSESKTNAEGSLARAKEALEHIGSQHWLSDDASEPVCRHIAREALAAIGGDK